MKKSEGKESVQEAKAKVRERYQGVDQNLLEIIPEEKKEDIFHPEKTLNVAVYARVSTDSVNQTSSYELQKNYYDDMVSRRPEWNLVDIYADEGISGTSLKHRDSFLRMIEDCKAGKIDLIITKSVSRFSRNIMDCIGYVRELKALKHPVGVYFETESINTLKDDTEMALSFTATMAQEESHIKSNIMNASIDMRFSRGIFLTPALLGYDQDENGNLVINEEEAKIVRLIFFMYLYGYSISEIANTLSSLKCSTKRGNVEWSYSSVCQILQNERHCGDVVARKTYTPDYLTHKSIKNTGKKRKIIHRDHHESIISRDDWLAVQRKLENQKNGTISFLPVLHVIKEGFLTGYIPINPRWAGFRAADYYQAAEEVSKGFDGEKQTGQSGEDESLSGYEVVRGAFFANSRDACVTISSLFMTFSSACVRKIVNSRYVEILFNPIRKKLAVRPAQKVDRHSIEWTRFSEDKSLPKRINGSAFLPAIFDVLCWDGNEVYRAHGIVKQDADYRVLIFDLEDAIVMIPTEKIRNENPDIEPINQINKKKTIAFPENWTDSFGINYAAYSVGNKTDEKSLKLDEKGEPFKEYDLKITDEKKVKQEITDLMEELGKNGKV